MNLTSEPWIPALRADGHRELFSLHDLFAQAHELRDLAARPHERIALMRLLLCITQAALNGPADEEEWEDCQPLIQPAVQAYLEKWKTAFELFGDGPRFLQPPNVRPGKELDEGNAATKLDLALATGNNSILFDNLAGSKRDLRSARSAINLLTFQCFAPGGRIGIAKWDGEDTVGKGSSNHAPCTPSSMVHTFVFGETLLATLHRNLLTKEIITDSLGQNRWGQPLWEFPVEKPQDPSRENATRSYLGRLVPLSRVVRLDEDGTSIILGNGLEYPTFPAFREATATVIKRKEELGLLPASTQRSLWRRLGAVSIKSRWGRDAPSGPLALNHPPDRGEITLWVGALVTDKAKIEDVVESVYALPAGMFTNFGRAAYEKGVAHAEEREGVLIQAVKTYASSLKMIAPAYSRARQHFWTRVEQHLAELFELARNPDLAADLPNSGWGRAVRDALLDAYEQSCPRSTPRRIEAYALGLRKLTFRPKVQPPIPATT